MLESMRSMKGSLFQMLFSWGYTYLYLSRECFSVTYSQPQPSTILFSLAYNFMITEVIATYYFVKCIV